MRNATSVKERLKNYAKKNNRIVLDIFTVKGDWNHRDGGREREH